MSTFGPIGLLIVALAVSALLVSLVAIPVLLARNFITKRPAWTGVRAWLLYPLLAAFMSLCGVGAFLGATGNGIDDYTAVKWGNITITAAFAIGYTVKKFWLFHKRWAFWTAVTTLAAGHFVVLSRLHWQQASYFWLPVLVGIPELAFVIFLLGLAFDPHGNLTKPESR